MSYMKQAAGTSLFLTIQVEVDGQVEGQYPIEDVLAKIIDRTRFSEYSWDNGLPSKIRALDVGACVTFCGGGQPGTTYRRLA